MGLFFTGCSSDRVIDIAKQFPHKSARIGDIHLEACPYKTEGKSYQSQCGSIVVPENRSVPESRLIRLPFMRIQSESEEKNPPIFYLTGGPGMSNLKFNPTKSLLENHDFIMIGYRGVDGSSVLKCPEIKKVIADSGKIFGSESKNRLKAAAKECFQRLRKEGFDLNGYNIVEVMKDIEDIRKGLKYEKINLLSESYGTRIAIFYAQEYSERSHRSVMIGANPPDRFFWNPEMIDQQIQQYSQLCSEDEFCKKNLENLEDMMRRVNQKMSKKWLFLTIDPDKVKLMTFVLLFHRQTAALAIDAYQAADQGDASGLALLSKAYDIAIPGMFNWGDFTLKAVSADYQPTHNYEKELDPKGTIMGSPLSQYFWFYLPEEFEIIPERYRTMSMTDVETLILSGNLDFSTPSTYAKNEILPYLKNGRQIIFSDAGHVNDLWNVKSVRDENLIPHFFNTGEVEETDLEKRPMEFDISFGLPGIAKGILVAGCVILAIPLYFLIF